MAMNAANKKSYDAQKERADKTKATAAEKLSKGKPTPTQEENDRAACGEAFTEHEDDGSGPDPYAQETRQSTAEPTHSGGYATRQSTAE